MVHFGGNIAEILRNIGEEFSSIYYYKAVLQLQSVVWFCCALGFSLVCWQWFRCFEPAVGPAIHPNGFGIAVCWFFKVTQWGIWHKFKLLHNTSSFCLV